MTENTLATILCSLGSDIKVNMEYLVDNHLQSKNSTHKNKLQDSLDIIHIIEKNFASLKEIINEELTNERFEQN